MNPATKNSFLDQIPIFSMLSMEEKEQLFDSMEYRVIPKYGLIFLEGDRSDVLYFLVRGVVKIATQFGNGNKEVIKSLIYPLAMFGELGLVGEQERQNFAQALKQDVHLFTLKVADLEKVMQSNFVLCNHIMKLFAHRLTYAENKLEALIFKDARTRIIDFIKDSIHQHGRRVGYELLLNHSLTHQDIANITCTCRQTVTLVLNDLKNANLIYFDRGKILVRDMGKLA